MKRLSFVLAGAVVAAAAIAVPVAMSNVESADALSGSTRVDLAGASLSAAGATTFKNCTALNKKYKHGVGKPGAVDRGAKTPVTNFYVSASLYKANKKSDRDGDGIACEKR